MCSQSDMQWHNLITSIFLSNKTVDEIKAEQKQIPIIKNNIFTIYHDALPFAYSNFDRFFDGEIRFPVISPIQYQIEGEKFNHTTLKVISTQEWIDGYLSYPLKSVHVGNEDDRKKLWEILQNQSTITKRFGFPNIQELITHYLKIQFDHGSKKDFEIVISPLVKIKNVQFSENQFIVNIQSSSELDGLQLNILLKRESQTMWRDTREIERTNNSIVFSVASMLPFDALEVELIHRESCLTLDRAYETVPLENATEPLLRILDGFCSIDKFRKLLFEPETEKKPQDVFEDAVTWLLSLAGFETIRLRIGRKPFDKLLNNGVYHVGSADIIAYEENKRILLIDCDIGTVDPKKVQKLAELKKHFRERLKGYEKLPIVPILFTPKDFRGASPSLDVMIADQAIIKRIFKAVAQGNREHARSLLYYSGL